MNNERKDDFEQLKGHMKDAVRSTLLAVRGAVDAAIDMLDRERDRPRDSGATARDEESTGPGRTPPNSS